MRRAWWTAMVAVAAAMTAAAGCQNSVTVGSNCPPTMPAEGDACGASQADQACAFADGPCQMSFVCAGDASGRAWSIDGTACVPAAVDCWSATEGDVCAVPGDSCGEGAGPCAYGFLNECGDDHHWHTGESIGGDCCDYCCGQGINACPASPPNEGDYCDPCSDQPSCGYEGFCGGGTATCGYDGLWHTSYDECPPPPQDPCSAYTAGVDCDADPDCRWLVAGCGGPELPQDGCYAAADCTQTGCDPGLTCQTVVVDPCYNKGCDTCSAFTSVCLP